MKVTWRNERVGRGIEERRWSVISGEDSGKNRGDENMIPPLPSASLSATGVALSGQTNRQPMIKRVGGLLPGGQGLFKLIDRDSYAKVIKQLLVFAILSLEQRVMASQIFYFFFFEFLPAV